MPQLVDNIPSHPLAPQPFVRRGAPNRYHYCQHVIKRRVDGERTN